MCVCTLCVAQHIALYCVCVLCLQCMRNTLQRLCTVSTTYAQHTATSVYCLDFCATHSAYFVVYRLRLCVWRQSLQRIHPQTSTKSVYTQSTDSVFCAAHSAYFVDVCGCIRCRLWRHTQRRSLYTARTIVAHSVYRLSVHTQSVDSVSTHSLQTQCPHTVYRLSLHTQSTDSVSTHSL